MNIAEYSIRKKVITLFMTALIIIGGCFSYAKLGRLEDPEFTIKDAQVITLYPGASAKEVEEQVTDKVEMALQQLPQLDRVESLSKPGVSIVTATIKDKYDKNALPQVWDELRRKITDMQSTLPPGAGPSLVNDDYGDVYGILFALTGKDFSYEELEDYADNLRKQLLLVPDVAKVNIWGIQPPEVHVEISRNRIAQLGISLNQIYALLAKQNLIVPSGYANVGNEYLRISPSGHFTSVAEIGDILIRSRDNSLIHLKDIATITRSYQSPSETLIRFNGEPALVIGISVVSGGNVVTMGHAVKERLNQLKAQLPLGLNLSTITFQADSVTASIDNFVISLIEAIIIVIVILMIFMGLRSGLLMGVVLLLTILATFIGMDMWHINLERISLGALIIALGMLVDNAIVITDGMLIKIQAGVDRIKAASEVVSQTSMPLLGATVIAILAFAAIGLSQDSTGEYTRSLFQVILISLFLSWVIAVTITPLLCAMYLKSANKTSAETNPYGGIIYVYYRRFLALALRYRKLTIGICIALLALSIIGFTFLENSFFPDSTRPQFMINFWLPEGTAIEQTSSNMQQLETYIKTIPGVNEVSEFVGSGAPRFVLTYTPEKQYASYGFILVNVNDYRDIDRIMTKIQTYADMNFIDAQVKQRRFILGPGTEDTIEIRFGGPDATVLRQLATKAKSILYKDGGLVGIKDNWRDRVKVIRPIFAAPQAREAGISKEDIDQTLQTNFSGLPIGIYREGDKFLSILSLAPPDERMDVANIGNIQIWSPIAQETIPLRQVTSGVETITRDANIQTRNRIPTLTVQASQKTGNASVVFERIRPAIEAIALPAGYTQEWGGEYEDAQKAQRALFSKIPLTLIIMILILVALFNSIRQPLIIMLTLPLAIIGVTIGLLSAQESFGFMALLGFLSLSGMLIKNAIVLIDQIDFEINEGKNRWDAIIDSSISRLRPVSMAAVTTVLGMIPLLVDPFFVAMAVTIMAGLTFATLLTLIVVPVLYAIFFRISDK